MKMKMKIMIHNFLDIFYKMGNIVKDIGKSITHGSRAVHKARRAKRAAKKATKAAKRGDIAKGAGKKVGRGVMAASRGDAAGVVKAGGFIE
jgi:hypothetical protein